MKTILVLSCILALYVCICTAEQHMREVRSSSRSGSYSDESKEGKYFNFRPPKRYPGYYWRPYLQPGFNWPPFFYPYPSPTTTPTTTTPTTTPTTTTTTSTTPTTTTTASKVTGKR